MGDLVMFRLLRLARLLRLLRLVKSIQALGSLYLMLSAIQCSLSILVWSACFLFVVQLLVAMVVHQMLETFMCDPNKAWNDREKVYQYFGSITRAMLTLFEMTLSSWVPVCRLLMEKVDMWWALFFVLYKLFMGFAVVKVVSAVFMHETFLVASADDDVMTLQRSRLMGQHRQKMKRLLQLADASNDGILTLPELGEACSKHEVRVWLLAQDIDIRDMEMFFRLVDVDNSGAVSIEELTKGLSFLKGPARSLDVHKMMYNLERLECSLHHVLQSHASYPDS